MIIVSISYSILDEKHRRIKIIAIAKYMKQN
jgi:hypothetical protein